jgi:uncharacterized membrane protein YphA (DoxX/SURF4 family)
MARAAAVQTGTGRMADAPVERTSWHAATRVAFRVAFVYLVLYSPVRLGLLSTPLLHTPTVVQATRRFLAPISAWAATRVFRASGFDPFIGADSVLEWSQVALFALIAVVAAIPWSLVDRKRRDYATLHAWLRLLVRLVLAVMLVDYGAQKIWPDQMPIVRAHQMLGELGSYSPRELLWMFIGASPGYERFAGSVELLGGALLFVPQLTTLGALVATAALVQVFAFNVFYDVEVKAFSLNLLAMAVFLLLPDVRRLADVFLFNRSTAARNEPRLVRSVRAGRAVSIGQVALGAAVVANALLFFRAGAPLANVLDTSRVPYYGVWDVDDFSLDGVLRQPLVTDGTRWQRLVFDDFDTASIQRMDGTVIVARLLRDTTHQTMTLTYGGDPRPAMQDATGPKWRAVLHDAATSPDAVSLEGQYDGRPMSVHLRRSTHSFALAPHHTEWIRRKRPLP